MKLTSPFALLFLLAVFCLAACAGRDAAPAEPEIKVRGQYDVSVGVRR